MDWGTLIAAAMAALFASVTPAAADPISALASVLVTTFGIGSAAADVIAAIVVTAVSTGLSYIANALLAPQPQKKPQGVSGTIQAGGALPRSFILGEFATAGSLVYAGTWGQDGKTPNAYLTYVIALSDLPMTALTQMWVGASQVTLSTSTLAAQGYAVPEYHTGGQDYLWIKFYDGTQVAADSFLISAFGSDPNYPWASDMVAPGSAYVIVTARLNPSLFSGFPQYKFAGQGVKLYDPRADSTAGGSGAQRLNDPTTWVYSNNPKVMEYNILLGIADSSGWLWGPQGMSQARLPFASWAAAMSECDSTVDDGTGTFVAQYRAGVEISVDMAPIDVIEALNTACNGKTAEIGGIYKTRAGAASSSVFSFTDDGVIISAANTDSPFPSLANVINGIAANYPEPMQGWAMTAAPPRNDTAAQAADGKTLLANVQYAAVPYSNQVQRLMAAALLEGRKFRTHTIVLPPPAWVLEPVVDTITWSSNINGYTTKQFDIKSVNVLANCDVQVAIAEVDPSDYSFNPATDYIAHVPVEIPLELPPILDLPVDDALALLRTALADLDNIGEALIHQQFSITETAASASGALAQAQLELTALIDQANNAVAALQVSLQSLVGDAIATGLLQFITVAGPGDAAASFAVVVRASIANAFAEAGFYMDALAAGGSRIRLVADQIELDGTLLTSGGVSSAMLASGAATGAQDGVFSGITGAADFSWHTLGSVPGTFQGGRVQLDANVNWDTTFSSTKYLQFRLTRDGGVLQQYPSTNTHGYAVAATQGDQKNFAFDDTAAAAGSHTYTVDYRWVGAANATQITFDGVLRVTEIRK